MKKGKNQNQHVAISHFPKKKYKKQSFDVFRFFSDDLKQTHLENGSLGTNEAKKSESIPLPESQNIENSLSHFIDLQLKALHICFNSTNSISASQISKVLSSHLKSIKNLLSIDKGSSAKVDKCLGKIYSKNTLLLKNERMSFESDQKENFEKGFEENFLMKSPKLERKFENKTNNDDFGWSFVQNECENYDLRLKNLSNENGYFCESERSLLNFNEVDFDHQNIEEEFGENFTIKKYFKVNTISDSTVHEKAEEFYFD